jgi:hypothetical protein
MPKDPLALGKLLNGKLTSHGKPLETFGKVKWRHVQLSSDEAKTHLRLAAAAAAIAPAAAAAAAAIEVCVHPMPYLWARYG